MLRWRSGWSASGKARTKALRKSGNALVKAVIYIALAVLAIRFATGERQVQLPVAAGDDGRRLRLAGRAVPRRGRRADPRSASASGTSARASTSTSSSRSTPPAARRRRSGWSPGSARSASPARGSPWRGSAGCWSGPPSPSTRRRPSGLDGALHGDPRAAVRPDPAHPRRHRDRRVRRLLLRPGPLPRAHLDAVARSPLAARPGARRRRPGPRGHRPPGPHPRRPRRADRLRRDAPAHRLPRGPAGLGRPRAPTPTRPGRCRPSPTAPAARCCSGRSASACSRSRSGRPARCCCGGADCSTARTGGGPRSCARSAWPRRWSTPSSGSPPCCSPSALEYEADERLRDLTDDTLGIPGGAVLVGVVAVGVVAVGALHAGPRVHRRLHEGHRPARRPRPLGAADRGHRPGRLRRQGHRVRAGRRAAVAGGRLGRRVDGDRPGRRHDRDRRGARRAVAAHRRRGRLRRVRRSTRWPGPATPTATRRPELRLRDRRRRR